jgi:hypothetical protein
MHLQYQSLHLHSERQGSDLTQAQVESAIYKFSTKNSCVLAVEFQNKKNYNYASYETSPANFSGIYCRHCHRALAHPLMLIPLFTYLFTVYLTTLPVLLTIQCRMYRD